jgi:predicted nuclease of predicted toxin-antitoxin system
VIFLIDNQLPIALARFIAGSNLECLHVRDVELDRADDQTIWVYAKDRGYVIVTKDEDFQAMANKQGTIPPQVVWVRLGNCRKDVLIAAFGKLLHSLKEELASEALVVEIR